MPRRLIQEMEGLLDEDSPHLLVAEVRRLARESGLDLEVGPSLDDALLLSETFVDSLDFEQLDEGLRDSWRWVLGKMWKVAKGAAKVAVKAKVGLFVVPALAGPYLLYKGAQATKWGVNKALKKLRGYDGGSGELLRGDEPFTLGDVTFHPMSQNRWRAMLPGRYAMVVKYKPDAEAFTCEIEGRKLGNYWNEDELGYAVQVALSAVRDEPS
jgi:hypothetical protein